ncbi:MAG: pyridoxamine 5'-phosphate oxidase family protein [Firmicutes bacterium]|nr:pyridoxamine 5'-phosphate oxidase family protein [Bacillota bacterium]
MDAKTKAQKLYRKVNTFILTCVGSDGYPLTKAVVPTKHRDSLGEMFFATNTSSNFANAVAKNPKGSVYFYSRKLIIWKGCFLKGNFEIVTDMDIKKKYWNPLYKGAYPGDDKTHTNPDFCVLRFVPTSARLYANFTLADFEV